VIEPKQLVFNVYSCARTPTHPGLAGIVSFANDSAPGRVNMNPFNQPIFSASYGADFRTRDVNVTLTGSSSAAGLTITVYEGSTAIGTTVSGAGGSWSLKTPTLTAGLKSFTATETVNGVESAKSPAFLVSIESAALTVKPVIDSIGECSVVLTGTNATISITIPMFATTEMNCPSLLNCYKEWVLVLLGPLGDWVPFLDEIGGIKIIKASGTYELKFNATTAFPMFDTWTMRAMLVHPAGQSISGDQSAPVLYTSPGEFQKK